MFTRFMYALHRVTGTLLSFLFIVWFVSGIVMIYHGFPRVGPDDRAARLEPIDTAGLPPVEALVRRLPDSIRQIDDLSVSRFLGQTVFTIRAGRETLRLPADSTETLLPIDDAYLLRTAAAWCNAPIAGIDTLHHLDQWIPFGSLREELPILRFRFEDPDHTQLYVAPRTGNVLQRTTRAQRLWAWAGAIPHWIYFTRLRQDADLWRRTVVWLSGLGCVMIVAGIYVGIHASVKARKRRKNRFLPYRKRWYYWHHVTGLVFGLFALTWAFSGMMSLADPPEWFMPQRRPSTLRDTMEALAPRPETYPDYRALLTDADKPITQIRWSHFFGRPVFELRTQGEKDLKQIDAKTRLPLSITIEEATAAVRRVQPPGVTLHAEQLDKYDTYYLDRKGRLPLPVYRIRAEDADHTVYYVAPSTGSVREYSDHRRARHWMYQGLHSLRFPWLATHSTIWTVVMWALLLGGTAVSVSGFVLGLRYIARLFRRRRKKHSDSR